MKNTYSIWIMPSVEIRNILEKIISELSIEYKTPKFEPHMTLLGDIVSDEKTIIEKTGVLAEKIKQFPLRLGEISFSTTYFQSVFVRVKSTATLMNANLEAKKLCKSDNNVFMPHISLIYGNQPMEEREKIVSRLTIPNNLSFNAERLIIVKIAQNPNEWKYVFDLRFDIK